MIGSVLIIVVSAALLIYWFRYTCLLILQTRTTKDYAAGLAAINGLMFPEIQDRLLHDVPADELPALQKSLAHDYRLLTHLLTHGAGLKVYGLTLEQRMLMLDFEVMRLFYALTRRVATSRACAALQEMSSILNHLANAMGERVQATSRG